MHGTTLVSLNDNVKMTEQLLNLKSVNRALTFGAFTSLQSLLILGTQAFFINGY